MSGKKTEAGKVALEYMDKYAGELSKRAIALMMSEQRPDLYSSEDSARSLVRYYTGSQGKKNRRHSAIHPKFNFFSEFPEVQLTDLFYDITADNCKILLLSDIHVPFHDKKALDVAVNYGVKAGADTIILNGDTFDHYSESSHEKDLGNRNPEWDYEQYQAFLFELRCAFPEAKIIFKIGNHEKRYFRWFVRTGMADMLNIKQFKYENIMQFDKYDITHISDYSTITCAGLNIIHGHEYPGGGGINPARWLSLRTKDSAICGHFHRASEHNENTHRGDIQTWWSTGCLCDKRPKYMPYNNWQHGFAFIIKEGEMYHVKNKRIFEGQIL